jgi:CBS domain containing-hemolysin-like protein
VIESAPLLLAASFGTAEVAMVAGVGVLILVSIFLAVAETSIPRVSRAKALSLQEEGRPGARQLVRLVDRPERWINALLLVLLVAQLFQATLIGVVAGSLFGALGIAVAALADVLVVFVAAEAAPKTWAIQNPERAALFAARPVAALVDLAPLRLVSRALIGLTNIILPGKGLKQGPFVSEGELLAMADVAAEADVIDVEERRLISSIIEFGDTIVREVMVPRPDMVTVNSDFRVGDVMEVVLLNGYSRIPVVGDDIDDVCGIVYAKDLMRAERDEREDDAVRGLARPARFVPETKRVSELLKEMQAEQFHMAIVVDEYGGTAGLVTLEDLIEELVGEIVDEYDVEDAQVEPLPGGDVRVSGSLSIDDANELLDVRLPEGDWDTVGGLLFSSLGRMAAVGDSVDVPGFRVIVDRVQGRRIMRVRLSRLGEPEHKTQDDRNEVVS